MSNTAQEKNIKVVAPIVVHITEKKIEKNGGSMGGGAYEYAKCFFEFSYANNRRIECQGSGRVGRGDNEWIPPPLGICTPLR